MNVLKYIGASLINFFAVIGNVVRFTINGIIAIFTPPFYFKIFINQCINIGYYSLPVVGMTTLFAGMVLALQSYAGINPNLASATIPNLIVLAITRELAPVLAGLMVAGRIGASIAAEVGTMRVTEQIDALQTLSTDPTKYLIAPRILAGIITLPILVFIGDIIGILGGYIVGVYKLGLNPSVYLHNTVSAINFTGIISGLTKASVFGLITTVMGSYQGYNSSGGAQGVGKATTNAVVWSSILILIANYIITEIFVGV
ncbi:MAG: MlaE family ABC transporter permease [Alphaproteobacteria bacterium]